MDAIDIRWEPMSVKLIISAVVMVIIYTRDFIRSRTDIVTLSLVVAYWEMEHRAYIRSIVFIVKSVCV